MKKQQKKWIHLLLALLTCMAVVVCISPRQVQAADEVKTFKFKGKNYRMETMYYYGGTSKLYQKTSSSWKKVASYDGDLRYCFTYKNKIYLTGGGEEDIPYTYTYTPGQKKFKKEKSHLYLKGHSGKYAIGYTGISGDPSPDGMCIYNLSNKKVKKLGDGGGISIIKNKVYYATISSSGKTMKIYRCNPDGSKKKVLKTFKAGNGKSYMAVMKVSKNKVEYMYCDEYSGEWPRVTAKF